MSLAVAAALAASAQGGKGIVVMTADGTIHEAVLAEVSRIDIGADALTVHRADGSECTHAYADIDRVLIGAETSGVDRVTVEAELTDGDTVTVTDINGRTVATGTVVDGTAEVSLSRLPAGIYLISSGNRPAVKIIKK